MADDRRFSPEYTQSRRILLGASTLLIIVSLPSITIQAVPLLGIQLTQRTPGLLVAFLAIALCYFLVQFLWSLHDEVGIYSLVTTMEDNALSRIPEALQLASVSMYNTTGQVSQCLSIENLAAVQAEVSSGRTVRDLEALRSAFMHPFTKVFCQLMAPHYGVTEEALRVASVSSAEGSRAAQLRHVAEIAANQAYREAIEGKLLQLDSEGGVELSAAGLKSVVGYARTRALADAQGPEALAKELRAFRRYIWAQRFLRKGRIWILELGMTLLLFGLAMTQAASRLNLIAFTTPVDWIAARVPA